MATIIKETSVPIKREVSEAVEYERHTLANKDKRVLFSISGSPKSENSDTLYPKKLRLLVINKTA